MIKKILIVMGILLLLIILFIAGLVIWTWHKSSSYEETAVPYIKNAITVISMWDEDVMRNYMSPEMRKELIEPDITDLVRAFSKMGVLISIDDPQFKTITVSRSKEHGAMKLVSYVVEAKYENGDATIDITLKDMGDTFNIHSFNLYSMALFK
jgi:hypothetical protein